MNETASSPRLTLQRVFPATRARLFEMWLEPENLRRFLCYGNGAASDILMDPKAGGSYHVTMHQDDGEDVEIVGVYREIQRPARLVFTWRRLEDAPKLEFDTLVTLEFHEHGEGTELVLTHEYFQDEEQRDTHAEGWSGILDKLRTLVL